ncbi:MAG TPA: hypothetical protein VMZ29_11660 [Candidatus Bathyarchaeia archaeon]|nr:hypothetical protein [Candidatus Bathyarchaeia archaeon]
MSLDNNNQRFRTTNELESNQYLVSEGFIISIILSLIAVGLLTLLILMIPNYPFSATNTDAQTMYDNFFYNIKYGYYGSYSSNAKIYPYIGYCIFMPVIVILFIISGTGVLVKGQKQTKALIFSNWLLYLIPMITGIILYFNSVNINYYNYYWREIIQPLGFYPIYLNLVIQTVLLIDRNSFRGWTGFDQKNNHSVKVIRKSTRQAIAIIFFLFYLAVAMVPIIWIASLKNTFYMFAVMWSCLGPYLGLFFFALLPAAFGKNLKKKIMELVSSGEKSIPTIAYSLNLQELYVQSIIKEKIASGEIFGDLSSDGLNIITKDPKLLFAIDNEYSAISPGIEERIQTKTGELGFWLSIGLTIIAVGIFTLLIIMVPALDVRTIVPGELTGENYFYTWEYEQYSGAVFQLTGIYPSSGFFIFAPIGAVTLMISGFGLPIWDKNQLKKLIYINWGLYIIPIIATVYTTTQILGSAYTYGFNSQFYITRGIEFSTLLSIFYFTPFIFIQGSMLVEKTTFIEWTGFSRKQGNFKQSLEIGRIINSVLFLLIFIWMWFYAIALIFIENKLGLMITHLSLLLVLFIWWFFGEALKLISNKNKQSKIIKYIVQMDITDLKGLASRLNLPLGQIQDIVYNYAKKNPSFGSLSADGLQIIPWNINDQLICRKCNYQNDSDSKFCSNCGEKFDDYLSALKAGNEAKDLENKQLVKLPKRQLLGILSFIIAITSLVCYIFILISWVKLFFLLYIILVLLYAGIILGIFSSDTSMGIFGYLINTLNILVVTICLFIIIIGIS